MAGQTSHLAIKQLDAFGKRITRREIACHPFHRILHAHGMAKADAMLKITGFYRNWRHPGDDPVMTALRLNRMLIERRTVLRLS